MNIIKKIETFVVSLGLKDWKFLIDGKLEVVFLPLISADQKSVISSNWLHTFDGIPSVAEKRLEIARAYIQINQKI